MPGFDESSARRISRSVLYTERQQGIPSTDANDNYGIQQGSSICLVKTGSVLPTGYDGSQAVLGNVIERQADGTDLNIGQVWIKDVNRTKLGTNWRFKARMGGTFTQDITDSFGIVTPTTLGLYLVEAYTVPPPVYYYDLYVMGAPVYATGSFWDFPVGYQFFGSDG